jgi:thiol-disulfide isomerase/thioredoxin
VKIRFLGLGLAFIVAALGCAPMAQGPKLTQGAPMPEVQLLNQKGDLTALSSLKDKAVFLNFWATWCGPCLKEMPDLIKAQDKYRDQGLVVIGANVGESKNKIDSFLSTTSLNFEVWREDDKQQTTPLRPLLLQLQGQGFGYSIPYSIALSRDGRVVATILGYDESGVAIEKAIQAALSTAPATAP